MVCTVSPHASSPGAVPTQPRATSPASLLPVVALSRTAARLCSSDRALCSPALLSMGPNGPTSSSRGATKHYESLRSGEADPNQSNHCHAHKRQERAHPDANTSAPVSCVDPKPVPVAHCATPAADDQISVPQAAKPPVKS